MVPMEAARDDSHPPPTPFFLGPNWPKGGSGGGSVGQGCGGEGKGCKIDFVGNMRKLLCIMTPFCAELVVVFSYIYILFMSANSVTDSEEGELNINGRALYVLTGFQSVSLVVYYTWYGME